MPQPPQTTETDITRQETALFLLNLAKAVRAFAFGCASVILALFLMQRGFSAGEIGAVISASLLEDAAVVALLSLAAARAGCCRVLMFSSLIMCFGGLLIAFGAEKWMIVAAVVFGTVSPAGYEAGAFASLEQILIPDLVRPARLARVFSNYNLYGFAGAALGALIGASFITPAANGAARIFFLLYAGIGLVLFGLYACVSLAVRSALGRQPCGNYQASQSSHLTDGVIALRARRVSFVRRLRDWRNISWLAGLQSLDSFGGGFVAQTFISLWFVTRFHSSPQFVGAVLCLANILAAASFLLAPAISRRFGLLNTMVFTHLPCSLLLCLIPFMPTQESAAAVLIGRCLLSSMDIPMRQAYAMILVSHEMRPQAASVTNSARAISQALAPIVLGATALTPSGMFFVIGGLIKSSYDALVYLRFRNTPLTGDSAPAFASTVTHVPAYAPAYAPAPDLLPEPPLASDSASSPAPDLVPEPSLASASASSPAPASPPDSASSPDSRDRRLVVSVR